MYFVEIALSSSSASGCSTPSTASSLKRKRDDDLKGRLEEYTNKQKRHEERMAIERQRK